MTGDDKMIWKVCLGFENYEVSEYGHVRRADNQAELRGVLNAGGYRQYNLSQNGRAKSSIAARLVLEAFVGPAPFDRAESCHNDGSRTNDHFTNLRWDTRSSNQRDKITHGTWSPRHFVKLSDAKIVAIRKAVASGVPRKTLCAEYAISSGRISQIINRKSWAHVA